MSLKRVTAILAFAAIPVFAGLLLAAESDQDHSSAFLSKTPGITLPGDNGAGTLSILPADDSKLRIEYRQIFFGFGRDKDKDKGASGACIHKDRKMTPPSTTPNPDQSMDRNKDLDPSNQCTLSRSELNLQEKSGSGGGMQYILDDSTGSPDNDNSGDADEPLIDTVYQSMIILAAAKDSLEEELSDVDMGTTGDEDLFEQDTGDTNADEGSRNMDQGSSFIDSFHRDADNWGRPGSSMDHGSLGNY